MPELKVQVAWLLLLAIPIACVAWTITHEEIFREPREFCVKKSRACRSIWERKFFYLFTCEYCFSHWVALGAVGLTRYHLLLPDWRGYVLALFGLVFVANVYMGAFGLLRLDVREERLETELLEAEKTAAVPPRRIGKR